MVDIIENSSKKLKKAFLYSSLAIEMGLSVLVGYLIGGFLDKRLDSEPWFLIIFILIGITAGMRSMIKAAFKLQKETQKKQDD